MTAASFYGHSPSAQPSLQSDTHQLWTRFRERLQFSIERSQQCQLEGSAPVSAIFPRQVEAFEFAADVLAFRRSLVNRHALQASSERHVYEIIRENVPCRLYFDLGTISVSSGVDGNALVARLVRLLQVHLFRCNQMTISKTDRIVQLNSSTNAKFSQHLIIHLRGNVLLKNNSTSALYVAYSGSNHMMRLP
ncbi:TPA: hypothetical protein N0F65_012951 [Lagenidium giganteum]|uniref:DNA-directed primase/polymerase protein n=1 Tax=Lagenidium giganteum TaxID=4803 RepID=A0AAV2Z3S4_9STRA|nr:TPA: hypothetical protein N0F65_012951 [Lagenidium giganteum]